MRFVEAVSDKLPSLSYKVYGVSRLWRVADIKQVARECGVEVKDYHLLGENNGANVLIQTQLPGVLQTAYEFQAAGVYINLDYTRPGTALVDSGASRMWWNTPEEDRRRVATAAACPASARTIAAALGTRDGRAVVDLCGDADEQTRQQIAAALAKLDTLLRRLNATKLEAKRTYTRKDAVPTGKPKKVVRVQLVGPDGWLLNEAQAHIIKNAVMCRIEEKYGALTDIQGGRWLYIAQTRSNEVLLDLGKSNAWLVADACRSVVGNPLLDAYPIVLDADLTVAAHTLQPASKTCIYKPSGSRLVRPDKGWAAPLQTSLPRRALAVRLAACGESRCSIDSQGKKVDRGLTAGLDVATLDSRSASGHTTSDDGIPDRPSPASRACSVATHGSGTSTPFLVPATPISMLLTQNLITPCSQPAQSTPPTPLQGVQSTPPTPLQGVARPEPIPLLPALPAAPEYAMNPAPAHSPIQWLATHDCVTQQSHEVTHMCWN